jgi:hypothetical protein
MAHQNSKEENQNKGPSAPNDAPKAKDISGEDAYKIVGAQGYRQRAYAVSEVIFLWTS